MYHDIYLMLHKYEWNAQCLSILYESHRTKASSKWMKQMNEKWTPQYCCWTMALWIDICLRMALFLQGFVVYWFPWHITCHNISSLKCSILLCVNSNGFWFALTYTQEWTRNLTCNLTTHLLCLLLYSNSSKVFWIFFYKNPCRSNCIEPTVITVWLLWL